jgi:hypothetical protein
MIEIYADYFYSNAIMQEHVYLDETQIALISEPMFYDKFSKYEGEYVGVWRFSIVIGGSGQSFSYLDEESCKAWYQNVKDAFMGHHGVSEFDSE